MNYISIIPTLIRDEHVCVTPVLFENTESVDCIPCTDTVGLVCKYSFTDRSMNDRDMWLSGHAYGPGRSEGIVDQDRRSKIGGPGLLLDPPSSSMNGGLVVLSGNPKALCPGRAMLAEDIVEEAKILVPFLAKGYTDIFNKVIRNEINFEILGKLLHVLKAIEDEKVDQHEGSVLVGKILKELYLDSAVRHGENLDKKHAAEEPPKPKLVEGKSISWKEYKNTN